MPTLVELFEAGVHFGHKKERSHPRAKEFIYTLRDGVYVIDLEKTLSYFESALNFLKRQIDDGKIILFVGTKRQAKELIKKVAVDLGMPYVNHHWLGGTLTNFETIQRNIREMERLEEQMKSPEYEALTKKEKKIITDKLAKLQLIFEGLRILKSLPDCLFILDANKESLALSEANKMAIPVVATCDTDANPDKIEYPIPANDDAAKSIDLIMNKVLEALKSDNKAQAKVETEKEEKTKKIEIKNKEKK